jgi:hypothetical protein
MIPDPAIRTGFDSTKARASAAMPAIILAGRTRMGRGVGWIFRIEMI